MFDTHFLKCGLDDRRFLVFRSRMFLDVDGSYWYSLVSAQVLWRQ